MKILKEILLAAALISLLCSPFELHARKTGYRFKTAKSSNTSGSNKNAASASLIFDNQPDSASLCKHLPGAIFSDKELNRIILTGFDKKRNNSKESFFVINKAEHSLSGIAIAIEYLTPDGRMLHKRYAIISVAIPAGETRKIDIPAWDTQHSFYYFKSDPDPSRGNPFTVVIAPIAISQDFIESDHAEGERRR